MSSFNSMNKAMIMGRLGKAPEVRYSQAGTAIASFSVATSESVKDQQGEWQEKTTWHNVVVFKNQAEACEKFLKKGSLVFVEGRIQNRSYTDKNGQEKYISEIVAQIVRFLDSKEDSGQQRKPYQAQQNNQRPNGFGEPQKDSYMSDDLDDNSDLPF